VGAIVGFPKVWLDCSHLTLDRDRIVTPGSREVGMTAPATESSVVGMADGVLSNDTIPLH
jgi:hypothetical protein